MTPAAVLVCMTIVSNVGHTTVASRACHYEQPPVAMESGTSVSSIAENIVNAPETDVRPLRVVDTHVKAGKPKYRKQATRRARVHHRLRKVTVQPVSSQAQNTVYRRSWFERLLDM